MNGPTPEFAFGGRLALDFTWTLRYRAVAPTELLATPAALARWIGLTVAPLHDPLPPALLEEAIALREAIHRAATALIEGRSVRPVDRRAINRWASRAGPAPQLTASGAATLGLRPGAETESALAAIAADAVALLGARDGRLRRCEGPACSLLFHDASRPGRRRWCATERCGNRVNTAGYRRRHRDTPSPS